MNEYASIMFRLLVKNYVNIDIRNVPITIKLAHCLPTLLRKVPQMLQDRPHITAFPIAITPTIIDFQVIVVVKLAGRYST